MKTIVYTITLILSFFQIPTQVLAGSPEESFFAKSIARESQHIEKTFPNDYITLAELHASRGEDYLLLGDDQKALEDFLLSYNYALNCEEEKNELLFRPLLGAFIVNIRLENLEASQEISSQLYSILKNGCNNCTESLAYSKSGPNQTSIPFQTCHGDWPILGPDQISVDDCLENVRKAVTGINILIAAVKRAEVQALAHMVINKLADTANKCCRAGGLWKGCLQKLGNKLHYWRVFGVPSDPAYDQMP